MSRVGLAVSVVTALVIKTLAFVTKTAPWSGMLHDLFIFSFFSSFFPCE